MENLTVERSGDGKVLVSFTTVLPAPSVEENAKYPFTTWNVKETEKYVGKACDRLAQAIANADFVAERVATRTASKSEERDQRKVEKLTAQLAAAQAAVDSRGTAPQPEAALPAPASAVSAPRRAPARKSTKGGRR